MPEWLDKNVIKFQELSGWFANPSLIGSNIFNITPRRPIYDVSALVMTEINTKIKELYDCHRKVIFLQTNEDDEKDKTLDAILIDIINDYIDILKYNYITECIYDEDCAVCYKRLIIFISHLEKQVQQLQSKEY